MAEDNRTTKVLEIDVNYGDAIKKIAEYNQSLAELRKEEKELRDSLKEEGADRERLGQQIAANKINQQQYAEAVRVLNKEVRNQIKAEQENEGSLKAMRAELSNMVKAYDELSAADRMSEQGERDAQAIRDLTNTIKFYEEGTERYYRNVGNYTNSMKEALSGLEDRVDEFREEYIRAVQEFGAGSEEAGEARERWEDCANEFEQVSMSLEELQKSGEKANDKMMDLASGGNPVVASMIKTASASGSLKTALSATGTAVLKLGKQFAKLLLNPVVAFFAAIFAAVMAVVKVFNNSEERTNRLKQAFSAFEPIVNAVKNAFGALADIVMSFIEVIASAYEKIISFGAELLNFIGIQNDYNEKVKESKQLEKDRQDAIKRSRELQVEEAQAELDVAKQRDIVAQKDKYTREERLAALEKAIAIEKDIADKRIEMARKNYENLEREAAMAENDAEMQNKLAEAKRDLLLAEKEYYDGTRRLQQQRSSFEEEDRKEQEDARKKAEEEEKRKADAAKQAAQQAAQRRKQEADKRAADAKDAAEKERQALQEAEDAMLALVNDQFQREYEQRRVQGERDIQALREKLETENNLTETARDAINKTIIAKERALGEELTRLQQEQEKKIADAETASQAERDKADVELAAKRLSLSIKEAEEWSAEKLRLQQEHLDMQKQQEMAAIEASKMTEEQQADALLLIQQDYNMRSLELNKSYNDQMSAQMEEQAEKEREIQQAKLDFAAQVFGGLSSLAEQFSEDNKTMAKLSKILALAEIAINTGKAVSAGIAQAQTAGPFPANLAAVATTVTTILSGMASAISTVKSAKFAKGGTVEAYSGGGYVSGPGTGTSDSISARLSNGESVNTALSTAMFGPVLSAMNQMGGGVPITGGGMSNVGEAMLARAVARGVASMPRPVVSVEEINSTQRRVEVLENLATI